MRRRSRVCEQLASRAFEHLAPINHERLQRIDASIERDAVTGHPLGYAQSVRGLSASQLRYVLERDNENTLADMRADAAIQRVRAIAAVERADRAAARAERAVERARISAERATRSVARATGSFVALDAVERPSASTADTLTHADRALGKRNIRRA